MRHAFPCAIALFIATSAFSATKTWTGAAETSTTARWTIAGNWSGGAAPDPGDDLVFPADSAPFSTNDFPTGTAFGSISIARFQHISGNPLQTTGLTVDGWLFSSLATVSGPTTINGGGLWILSNGQFSGPMTVNNASLESDGANVGVGALMMTGSRLRLGGITGDSPQLAYADLTAASLSLDAGSNVFFAISPTKSSKIIVNGQVALAKANFGYDFGFFDYFPAGTQIRIIDNLGSLPISGMFAGLPEGATLGPTMHGAELPQKFTISYAGGDGNDVVLTALPAGSSSVELTTSPNPVIAGQPITLTATVRTSSGPATGSVQFVIGPGFEVPWTCTAPLNASGLATCSATRPAGIWYVSASWPGTATIVGSRSQTITQSVIADIPALDRGAMALLGAAIIAIAFATLRLAR